MNNLCQYKRGFFTLRACNRPASKQCESCGRLSCQYHLSAQTGMRLCVECAQKQNRAQEQDFDSEDWVYSYRNWYYTSGYEPFRFGNRDYLSFETGDDGESVWDDDHAGDFGDS